MPPARIARAQQDAPAGARDTRLRQVEGADAALHSTEVRDPGRADEALGIHSVDSHSALDEMPGRVDVCPGMRSETELADADAIFLEGHHRADPHRRIPAIDRHRVADRDRDIDELHGVSG